MKHLIISSAIIAVLIGSWLFFDNYSKETVYDLIDDIQNELIPEIEKENWDESEALMKDLKDHWHEYKKLALLFLNTDTLCEIDYGIARAEKYIISKDMSNSSGELNSTAEEMRFLLSREKINVENIL